MGWAARAKFNRYKDMDTTSKAPVYLVQNGVVTPAGESRYVAVDGARVQGEKVIGYYRTVRRKQARDAQR